MRKSILILMVLSFTFLTFSADINIDFANDLGGLISDQGTATVTDGKLKLSSTTSNSYANVIDVMNSFSSMNLSVDAEFTSIDTNTSIMIFFRTQSNDNGYAACFYPGGYFNIQHRDIANGSVSFLISSVKSSYITSSINDIKIIAVGNEMQFFCNGSHIYTLENTLYSDGTIALAAGGISEVEFDNLLVTSSATLETKIHATSLNFNFDSADELLFWKDWYGTAIPALLNSKLRLSGTGATQVLSLDADLLTEDSISFRADIVTPDTNSAAQAKYGIFFFTHFNGAYIDGYIFNVYNKNYFLFKVEEGISTQIGYGTSNALLAGGADFSIVPHAGGKIDILINGELAKTFIDDTFTYGGIALNITNNIVVDFDDLKVNSASSFICNDNCYIGSVDDALSLSATPNPFNPSTTITWNKNISNKNGLISIYNISGELVYNTSLKMTLGSFNWNAKNMSSGKYLIKLSTNEFTSLKIVSLIK